MIDNVSDQDVPNRHPLPIGWRWARLGEVATYLNGRAFKPSEWSTAGLPIIRIQNLTSPDAPFNRFSGPVSEAHRVSDGDLLVSWSASLDAFFWQRGDAVLNQHIFKVAELADRIDRRFLFYALRNAMVEIRSQVHGATMRHITKPEFEAVRIPLPALAEQRRIAALLDERIAILERARSAARAAREAAASMERACLRHAFHGICPLAADASARTAPRGWRWRLLVDLARLETGHTPSRSRPDWWGGPIPWLALPDIRRLDGRTAEQTLESTNADGIANSAARVLPTGTVVLSRTASIGFVTVLGREMATSQDFVNWVCGPELEPWFLAHLLRASRQFLLFLGSGAVHKTVYFPAVQAFRVCVPDVEAQRRIVAALGGQLAQAARVTASLDAELAQLDALHSSLLRYAFSEGA